MRFILLICSVAPAFAYLGWQWLFGQPSSPENEYSVRSSIVAGVENMADQTVGIDLIQNLDRYDDLDYGFSVAVPTGWRRIIASDDVDASAGETRQWVEPGYAVGFESPRSGNHDRFADYILIEVLPGDDSGLFAASEEHRHFLRSGESEIGYDKLIVDSETDSETEVDLIIFQRGVQAFGYTLGFFAVGEPANERALFQAFQIMLRTFKQSSDPFVII